jgi:uncharacterized protein YheU (UPF0270 family)
MAAVVPYERLGPEILRALIEEFVTRDGTIYGHRDVTLEQMTALVRRQVVAGTVLIVYDEETQTCTLVPKERAPREDGSGDMGGGATIPTSCDGCGLCCRDQPVPPYMDTELDALPTALLAQVESPWFRQRAEGPRHAGCPWLNAAGKCGHYAYRPTACREYEMGGEECLALRQRVFGQRGR